MVGQSLKNIYHFLTGWFFVFYYGFPARKLKIIGVTGTDGKTTTSHLIYEMLKASGKKVALISTVADTGFHVTNPDARSLQKLLSGIVDQGFKYLVLEVTSHGLDQHRVLGCNFLVGVVTNITHEHLDYHGNFARYREAKAKLIFNTQYSILNKNDSSFGYLKSRSKGQVVPYAKTKIKITNPKLAGEYNKYNVGAAEAVSKIFNIQYSIFSKAVRNFSGVPGRMEEIKLGQLYRAIVDFAHTPNALEQVLTELSNQVTNNHKLIVVFGCAGLRDKLKRPMMGKIAARLADKVIITAEDPRTENLDDIYNQIVSKVAKVQSGKVIREDNRQKAINMAVNMAKPGDIVIVTGKGHEKSMCFGTTEYPWSDVEAVKKAILR